MVQALGLSKGYDPKLEEDIEINLTAAFRKDVNYWQREGPPRNE